MATGVNVSKVVATAVVGPPDLSVSKVVVEAVANSLVSRISQVSITVPVEVDDINKISQVVNSPIIEAESDAVISQVTLALIIPSTYYPPDDWEEPYPCTVIIDREQSEFNCFSRIPKEIACLGKTDSGYLCLTRVDKEIACIEREKTECVGIDRSCEDE